MALVLSPYSINQYTYGLLNVFQIMVRAKIREAVAVLFTLCVGLCKYVGGERTDDPPSCYNPVECDVCSCCFLLTETIVRCDGQEVMHVPDGLPANATYM